MKATMLALLLLSLVIVGPTACGKKQGDGAQIVTALEGFEAGLGPWTARGLDTFVSPGDEIAWSITPSAENARTGLQSVKVSVDNRTDAAKVWLERSFDLLPSRTYDVTVAFDFGTTDFGDFNLWTIMAGALPASPQTVDDLPMTGDNTSAGSEPVTGVVWLHKTYTTRVTTGPSGKLYVPVGVWGTWETQRVYFLDNLEVTLSPVWPIPTP
jgi:hypothetical protein